MELGSGYSTRTSSASSDHGHGRRVVAGESLGVQPYTESGVASPLVYKVVSFPVREFEGLNIVGIIVGVGGARIQSLRRECDCNISVLPRFAPAGGALETTEVVISGHSDTKVRRALKLVSDIVSDAKKARTEVERHKRDWIGEGLRYRLYSGEPGAKHTKFELPKRRRLPPADVYTARESSLSASHISRDWRATADRSQRSIVSPVVPSSDSTRRSSERRGGERHSSSFDLDRSFLQRERRKLAVEPRAVNKTDHGIYLSGDTDGQSDYTKRPMCKGYTMRSMLGLKRKRTFDSPRYRGDRTRDRGLRDHPRESRIASSEAQPRLCTKDGRVDQTAVDMSRRSRNNTEQYIEAYKARGVEMCPESSGKEWSECNGLELERCVFNDAISTLSLSRQASSGRFVSSDIRCVKSLRNEGVTGSSRTQSQRHDGASKSKVSVADANFADGTDGQTGTTNQASDTCGKAAEDRSLHDVSAIIEESKREDEDKQGDVEIGEEDGGGGEESMEEERGNGEKKEGDGEERENRKGENGAGEEGSGGIVEGEEREKDIEDGAKGEGDEEERAKGEENRAEGEIEEGEKQEPEREGDKGEGNVREAEKREDDGDGEKGEGEEREEDEGEQEEVEKYTETKSREDSQGEIEERREDISRDAVQNGLRGRRKRKEAMKRHAGSKEDGIQASTIVIIDDSDEDVCQIDHCEEGMSKESVGKVTEVIVVDDQLLNLSHSLECPGSPRESTTGPEAEQESKRNTESVTGLTLPENAPLSTEHGSVRSPRKCKRRKGATVEKVVSSVLKQMLRRLENEQKAHACKCKAAWRCVACRNCARRHCSCVSCVCTVCTVVRERRKRMQEERENLKRWEASERERNRREQAKLFEAAKRRMAWGQTSGAAAAAFTFSDAMDEGDRARGGTEANAGRQNHPQSRRRRTSFSAYPPSEHLVRRTAALQKLGLSETADDTAVRRRYRKLALELHPDKNAGSHTVEEFVEVTKAYRVLLGE